VTAPSGSFCPLEAMTQTEGDVVTGPAAGSAHGQIDLQLAEFGGLAGIIVPHQAVEVEWRGCAGVSLHRGDLGRTAGNPQEIGYRRVS
jgi:hypothetical protein